MLSPYFFTDGGRRYEKAEYVVVDCDGPFSTDVKIVKQIEFGAERRASNANARNRQNTSSNSEWGDNVSSTCVQSSTLLKPSLKSLSHPKPISKYDESLYKSQVEQSASKSQHIPSGSTPGDSIRPMDTDNSHLCLSEDDRDTNVSSENTTSDSQNVISTGNQVDPETMYEPNLSSSQANQSSFESQGIPSGSTLGDSEESVDEENTDLSLFNNDKDTSYNSENTTSESQIVTPAGNQGVLDTKHDQNISNSPVNQSLSEFQDISSGSTSSESAESMDTDDSDLVPSQDDKDKNVNSENTSSLSQTVTLAGNQVDPDSMYDQRISKSLANESSSDFQNISSGSHLGDSKKPMEKDDTHLILSECGKVTSSTRLPQTITPAGTRQTQTGTRMMMKKHHLNERLWKFMISSSICLVLNPNPCSPLRNVTMVLWRLVLSTISSTGWFILPQTFLPLLQNYFIQLGKI